MAAFYTQINVFRNAAAGATLLVGGTLAGAGGDVAQSLTAKWEVAPAVSAVFGTTPEQMLATAGSGVGDFIRQHQVEAHAVKALALVRELFPHLDKITL